MESVAFGLCTALVFLRFSMLHQIQSSLMGVNLRLLWLCGVPATVAMILAGGIGRSFRGRPALYYTGFALWMGLSVPFSTWRSDSVHMFFEYIRTDAVMLFMVAGLVVTWRQCRIIMMAIGLAAIVNLCSAQIFMRVEAGRVGMEFGSISNPNDFAGHLILTLAFLVWAAVGAKHLVVRLGALAALTFGLKLILGTASRGAFVGLLAGLVFYLLRAPAKQKLVVLLLGPLAVAAAVAFVPQSALHRIQTFRATNRQEDEGAIESQESREYLLRQSIKYTFEFPLFGVGLGQFPSYEGEHNKIIGTHGYWHDTHNSYTQASSECGIPALIFMVCGIVSTYLLLSKTFKKAARRGDSKDIRDAAFALMLGLVAYCVAIFFLNFAYFFYLPVMGGLAIAIAAAAEEEFRKRDLALAPAGAGLTPVPHRVA